MILDSQQLMPAVNAAEQCGKVAVLMGGNSAEREVSLMSGQTVIDGLLEAGVDAIAIDTNDYSLHQLADLKVDRLFNILHGRGGEDGRIQALADFLKFPCTGSGICASALTMDKLLTKKVLRCSGIPTPDFMELSDESDCQRLIEEFGLPVFIKPCREGSSIGMSPVYQAEGLLPAWRKATQYGPVFAEKLVTGAEYTAGFLGQNILPLIKLDTPREFYDYEAKYFAEDTIYVCPCGLDQQTTGVIDHWVSRTIKATGVRDWGRVDLMLDEESNPWVIEVNTVPGMTSHSLVPMAAREAGLDLPQLVLKILEFTLSKERIND